MTTQDRISMKHDHAVNTYILNNRVQLQN